MLRDKMDEGKNYQMAMDGYLSQPPTALKDPVAKYPTGEERYGRLSSIDHFNWLSLLPRRLKAVGVVCRFSRSDWQLTHKRTPGIALRRASGIKVSHSSQWVEP